jgi:nicotinamidase-related amidase
VEQPILVDLILEPLQQRYFFLARSIGATVTYASPKQLFKQALPMAKRIAALKSRAKAAGVPIIYVNDNFGHWRSDLKKQISHCRWMAFAENQSLGSWFPITQTILCLKPKSSAFFGTTLHTLLQHLGVNTLVLTGVAADVCILFTAHDAHLRDYEIIVPSDCVASNTLRETKMALANMQKAAHASICKSTAIKL